MTVISSSNRFIAALAIAVLLQGCSENPASLVASAKEYAAKNDHNAAVIQLKNALQQDPKLAEARFLLGRALLETGDVVGAEKELRRAMELNYPVDQLAPPLARALVAIGQHEKALEEFGSTVLEAPAAKAELQTALAYAQLARRDMAAARKHFDAAVAADPRYLPAQLGQARVVAGAGQFAQALEIVEKAIALAADKPEAWQLKGDLLQVQRQSEPALAAYRKALEVKPDYLPSHSSIVSMLMREQKLAEAGKQLDALKRLAPKHPRTAHLLAQYELRQKNFPAAEAAIQQALSADPENLSYLLLSAVVKLGLQSYEQSEANALKVLSRAPNQPLARRVLVSTYLKKGELPKAIEALKPGLEQANPDPLLLGLAGEAYMMQGDHAQAAALFARAAKLAPENTAVRTALALSHLAGGEIDRGLGELEQTAAADSGIRSDLALIAANMQRGAYDRALAAIDALEKKQPRAPLAHNLRGAALIGKKDLPGARKSFSRAIELDPLFFPAAANLARLDLIDKKPEAARGRFEAILAKDEKHLQALLALAELRARGGGSPDEVAALIKKAITAHPQAPGPRVALIGLYLSARDQQNAITAARSAMSAVPDQVDIMAAAARAYEAAGETDQAVALYKKIAQIQPNSPTPHLRMAQAHAGANHKEEAAQSLRQALTMKPALVEAQRGLIALNLASGRVQEALDTAKEVQKQRPKQSIGYMLEGDIYASKEKWPEAVAAYRTGLKRVGSTELAIRVHTALTAVGKGADEFAATWLKENPEDREFRVHIARASMIGKNYQSAVKQYLKVLESEPNNAGVLNNLAWVSWQLQDPKAVQYAEAAYKLAPDHPAIMDTLGMLLLEKGDTARGLDLLRKAAAAAPGHAEIRLNLARGLIAAGQKDEARKELDALAKLGDKFEGHSEVAKLRKQL